ncbi:hypothetical protein O6H91_11G112600 [Diphasiastrum complanatum]|uniref:Uncharacterized protein n=1 Tax=Diphasiastrum complanatum TaxID=34168 RepID=A0ACC2CCV7_DIPCM|nr:hypothetical protein O6H91_11G112600 [Diphasiastrum complanatum]
MATSLTAVQAIAAIQTSNAKSISSSAFLTSNIKKNTFGTLLGNGKGTCRIVCEAEGKPKADRWKGLGYDISDDQQDITRGKGMVDSLFQGPQGAGTQHAIMSTYDYISTGQRTPIMMSAGELESGNAGEPAKLIRQRYREAADIIKKGTMCALFINDLDAGAGRMGGTTQYTVNNQMVNATLMNIADNPTNVQLPGMYNKDTIPRVPIVVTGNDFSTLYAPLIRDGRMEKFYWAPTREDRIGVCNGIFRADNVHPDDVVKLVDTFPGQSIDFFGALRSRVYDDEVRKWIASTGVENLGSKLVNSKEGPPVFQKPAMTVEKLLEYGHLLVKEQENVKRVQLADKYLKEAALGDANEDSIKEGTFFTAA